MFFENTRNQPHSYTGPNCEFSGRLGAAKVHPHLKRSSLTTRSDAELDFQFAEPLLVGWMGYCVPVAEPDDDRFHFLYEVGTGI